MIGNLHSYMKVGIVSFMAYPGPYPVVQAITNLANDEFFTAIEVTHVASDEDRATVKTLLAASGLECGYGAQPVQLGGKLDVNSLDTATRRAALTRLFACADEAQALGCGRLALLSGPYPGPEKHAQATEALVESLNELCAYAAPRGIEVALEVFDREIDKKALIGPTSEAVAVAEAVRRQHANFGLMIDLSHLPLQFETATSALRQARDFLIHAHIGNAVLGSDHPAFGDQHPRFGLPGGSNDYMEVRQFLSILMEIGYLGEGQQRIVAFEVKPLPGETPELVIANAKRTLVRAWAGL
ncbi:MAG: sugar phosphate isomerase/epimerase family protein [Chloroflexota bacterium]